MAGAMSTTTPILSGTRVLVTGGAGFIGSNLAERLLAQDNEVVVLDNFSTGKRENVAPFLDHPRFTLIEGDIRSMETCRKAVDGARYVLHHAALGSVPLSIDDPALAADVNITGTVNVFCAAHKAGVERVVYAASSATYGDSKTLPQVEHDIGTPLSPYAITKYVNELFAQNFAALYGLSSVGLRYFNIFGPRQDPHGAYAAVLPLFAKALVSHAAPTINGDGSFSRDYTYIENVIQANQRAALATGPAANQVYNIACGAATSLTELFTDLRSLLARFDPAIADIQAVYGPERVGDIPHSVADITKARTLLGYAPTHGVPEGLLAAARWYFDHLR